MAKYLGITFREGYKSFPEFKKEIELTDPFKKFPPPERLKELEKAYKIATGLNSKDELPRSIKKSRKPKSGNGKQGTVSGGKKD